MRRLLFFLIALPAFAASSFFTLEQVLSAPFASDLVASPRHDAVAWVQYERGARNVWVARAPEYKGAPWTKFTGDDGQEIDNIVWKPDSSLLFFTRGGGPNGRGEIPNPTNDPAGAKQEVWMAFGGGQARRIADGHNPAVTPDGVYVAWISANQVWSARVDNLQPAQLIQARGIAQHLTFSPDSHKLAFMSLRGDHGFAAVYDIAKKTLIYPDASVDRDSSPVWSPDSSQLAFIREPASKYAFAFGPKRTAQPWSIRVVDVNNSKARELWRAQPGMGSAFWPWNADDHLLWSSNGQIVFPWERDGWLHIYEVPAKGGEATLLTPGKFEVEHVALSADASGVLYSSNQDDINRRHMWAVPATGGTPRRLTQGEGIEGQIAALDGSRIAVLRSDAKLPVRPALFDNNSLRDLAPQSIPSDFPTASLQEPEQVTFSAADGMTIHGQIFRPAAAQGVKHAGLIFFHGGSRRQMMPGWHHMQYYNNSYAFNQYLASKGYVVLSVNYRSGIGYGEEFREALNYGATGASEYNDVMGAGLYMRARADVDPARIGLWGGSYGGYLTALGLARASDLFKVGVDWHGVHDWNLEIPTFAPGYDPKTRQDDARLAFDSSPMSSIATWRSPVLLIHGDDDRNVPFAESVQLAEALRNQGVYFEQLIFPDEVHDLLLHSSWLKSYHAAEEFLGRYLKP
jgi:dipeptidyl aminopeptidase/acylaminoacyl peptidase